MAPPSEHIPSPDKFKAKNGFTFNRLGVRIPTIAISPWIKKGTLVNRPTDEQKPNEYSEFETASIPATVMKLFSLKGRLTARTDFAATFDNLITSELRDDCIETLPSLPNPPEGEVERILNTTIDDTTYHTMVLMCKLN